MKKRTLTYFIFLINILQLRAQIPSGYKGLPFKDSLYLSGAQVIPGRVELVYYDLGGDGVAYHDTTPTNDGAVLNHTEGHPTGAGVLVKEVFLGAGMRLSFFAAGFLCRAVTKGMIIFKSPILSARSFLSVSFHSTVYTIPNKVYTQRFFVPAAAPAATQ